MRVGEPATKKRVPKECPKDSKKRHTRKGTEQADSNPCVCVLTHAIIGLLDELVHHPVAL